MKTGLPKLTEAIKAKGFALIATITLMLLLALLSVGVLTLASVQTRVSKSGRYMSEARAQARLAVEMAIGRLQCDLGPDQRISANSSIITDGNSVHKNILGVWNSWKTWLNATDPQGQKITNTYTTGRKSQFRSWLISSPLVSDSTTLEALQTGGLGIERPEKVLLLGRGTLGQDYPSPADFVYATLIETPSMDVNAKKAPNRSYVAWWVTGENQKANLALPATPEAKDALSAQKYSATAPRPSASNLGLIPAIPNIQDDDLDREKSLTLGTLNLNGSGANSNGVPYFDVTTQSQSLMTDVRAGGLKKDLSLFLNMTEENIETYAKNAESGASSGDKKRFTQNDQSDAPLRAFDKSLKENSPSVVIRPIGSWQQLHLWSNLWRKTPKTPNSSSSGGGKSYVQDLLDFSTGVPISFTAGTETYEAGSSGALADKSILDNKKSYMRYPVPLALYHLFGLRLSTRRWGQGGTTFSLVNMQLMLWWNPYTVPLHIKAKGWYAFATPYKTFSLQAMFYNKNKTVAPSDPWYKNVYPAWDDTYFRPAIANGVGSYCGPGGMGDDYGTHFYNSNEPKGTGAMTYNKGSDIELKPGEMVWFSVCTPDQIQPCFEIENDNLISRWYRSVGGGQEETAYIPYLSFEWKARSSTFGGGGGATVEQQLNKGVSVRLTDFTNNGNTVMWDIGLSSQEDSIHGMWAGDKFDAWTAKSRGTSNLRYDLRWGNELGTVVFDTGFGYPSDSTGYTSLVSRYQGSNRASLSDNSVEHDQGKLALPSKLNLNWFTSGERIKYGKIISANWAEGIFDSSTFSTPFAVRLAGAVGVVAKNGADMNHVMNKDHRSKTWLYSNPAVMSSGIQSPNDAKRVHSAYQLDRIIQSTDVSTGFQVAGRSSRNGTFGIRDNPDAEQVSSISSAEIPLYPPMSIAALSGMRMSSGWFDPTQDQETFGNTFDIQQNRRFSYSNGIHAVGIGNSFADPMIATEKIHNSIKDNPAYLKDYWDHNFLVNDALWDGYFFSSISDRPNSESDPGSVETAETIAKNFFDATLSASSGNKDLTTLPNYRLKPTVSAAGIDWEQEIAKPEAWVNIAQYLVLQGGFNVNSTSLPAWKAQLKGLKQRPMAARDYYGKKKGKLEQVPASPEEALFSRFITTTGATPISDSYDPTIGDATSDGLSRWLDLRALTDTDLDALAEQIVIQVRQRGPFLSMSEFINRRLMPSREKTSLKGALQAAIDETSINDPFVTGYELDTKMARSYSTEGGSPEAALGSRYTAAPGYLIQSDLLKALGNVLTVRDDTFKVRAFGCIKAANGKDLLAQTWCEAVVQRQIEYVDPSNPPNTPALIEDSTSELVENGKLSALNKAFGRRMKIVEFRWLSSGDV